jgi:hypothetical protein
MNTDDERSVRAHPSVFAIVDGTLILPRNCGISQVRIADEVVPDPSAVQLYCCDNPLGAVLSSSDIDASRARNPDVTGLAPARLDPFFEAYVPRDVKQADSALADQQRQLATAAKPLLYALALLGNMGNADQVRVHIEDSIKTLAHYNGKIFIQRRMQLAKAMGFSEHLISLCSSLPPGGNELLFGSDFQAQYDEELQRRFLHLSLAPPKPPTRRQASGNQRKHPQAKQPGKSRSFRGIGQQPAAPAGNSQSN